MPLVLAYLTRRAASMSHMRYVAIKVALHRHFLQSSEGTNVHERISSLVHASAPYCGLWAESAWVICTHICTYIVICGEESEGRHGGRRRGRAKGKRGPCPTPGVLLTRCAALPRGIRVDTCMYARMHIHTRTYARTHVKRNRARRIALRVKF